MAKVIRSKSARSFLTTIDIMFEAEADYRDIVSRGIITEQSVRVLYGLAEGEVSGVYFARSCTSIKVTLINRIPSADFGNANVYGAQQYIPFVTMPIS